MALDASSETEAASTWWVFIVTGVLWTIFGLALLSFSWTTVWGIAVFAGIGFLIGGFVDLIAAFQVRRHRWINLTLGIIGIVAGVIALTWPGMTFVVLARLLAWTLFISGLVMMVSSLMTRHENDAWVLQLLLGILNLAIGLWAVRNTTGSFYLLALWAALAAIAHGIADMFIGAGLHGVKKAMNRTATA